MGDFGSVFLVDVLAIDEAADAGFVAAWEQARAFLQSKGRFISAELLRTIRPHARFRYANLVEVGSVDTWRQLIGDPDFPLPEIALNNHPGLYEMVHEDRRDGHVVVVNAFDLPADAGDSSFTGPWNVIHDYMVGCPGHGGARLFRCVGPADFRYVAVTQWHSEDAFADAVQSSSYAELAPEMPFDVHTGVYEVIRS